MSPTTALLLASLIGLVCGLRSMMAPAVVSWGAYLGWLSLEGSTFAFLGHTTAVVVFTVLAVGELVADKLPFVPSRTIPPSLALRVVVGAACAAALSIAGHQLWVYGALVGAVGAIIGAYAGYGYRQWIPADNRLVQILAALLEDAVAIAGALWIVTRF